MIKWDGGINRLIVAHVMSLICVGLIGGMGFADGGAFAAPKAIAIYSVPQLFWFIFDFFRMKKKILVTKPYIHILIGLVTKPYIHILIGLALFLIYVFLWENKIRGPRIEIFGSNLPVGKHMGRFVLIYIFGASLLVVTKKVFLELSKRHAFKELREYKKLLDAKIITQEEYESKTTDLKKKIL
tara:strand:+ start:862 stop:1413 length:552 start_codon:yes stop_codon:yes gene_type:complete